MPDVIPCPDVVIEEGPRGARPIAGVPTAVAAFVGTALDGPVNEPLRVASFTEYTAAFGGLEPGGELGYAVSQFFVNGGREAWVVRASAGDPAGGLDAATALSALDQVDPFNLLNLPGVSDPAVLSEAVAYAAARRAMVLVDLPAGVANVESARGWLEDPATQALRQPNAVACFPRVRVSDPLDGGQPRSCANAGTIAGLYARNDARRGVWDAPAGLDAQLQGVVGLDCALDDAGNGVLNRLGLNCLRHFPQAGFVCWGARTLAGADGMASEWKYVPVRRLFLFLEASIDRGTRWAVFEPNGEALWARLRQVIDAFMHDLFRAGAFQGRTPREAWFVKCDSSTTTQADIDRGVVNVMVGFAPLKPAEFVIIRIQQKTATS